MFSVESLERAELCESLLTWVCGGRGLAGRPPPPASYRDPPRAAWGASAAGEGAVTSGARGRRGEEARPRVREKLAGPDASLLRADPGQGWAGDAAGDSGIRTAARSWGCAELRGRPSLTALRPGPAAAPRLCCSVRGGRARPRPGN